MNQWCRLLSCACRICLISKINTAGSCEPAVFLGGRNRNIILNDLTYMVPDAFEHCGLSGDYGSVTVSRRPDLCQFQCSGALSAAKK